MNAPPEDMSRQTTLGNHMTFEGWTPENTCFLIKRWNEGVSLGTIAKELGHSFDRAKELLRLNPLVRAELMADVGHGLPYDEPSRLGGVVPSFLRRLASFGDEAVLAD